MFKGQEDVLGMARRLPIYGVGDLLPLFTPRLRFVRQSEVAVNCRSEPCRRIRAYYRNHLTNQWTGRSKASVPTHPGRLVEEKDKLNE